MPISFERFDMTPADQYSRQEALKPDESFAVIAPAGSGKTELLVRRLLVLLARVERPENILAITFTRKAAAEMRARLLHALELAAKADQALADAESDSQADDHKRVLACEVLARDEQMGWRLLDNPNRLKIQTIDSFCRYLSNQLCLDSGQILPDHLTTEPQQLCQIAAQRLLARLLDQQVEQSDIARAGASLLGHLGGNTDIFIALVAEQLAARDSWLPLLMSGAFSQDQQRHSIADLVSETLHAVGQRLIPFEERLNRALVHARQNSEGAVWQPAMLPDSVPAPDAEALPGWRALRHFLITGPDFSGRLRSPRGIDKRLGFPATATQVSKQENAAAKQAFCQLLSELAEVPDLLEWLNRTALLPDLEVEHTDMAEVNLALWTLLPRAVAELVLLCQERNEIDFTGISIAGLQALGLQQQPTPLALRLDYRIQHILVDEFQDTSSIQMRLLDALCEGWQPGDGRSLFIVGDGMQSIYGFRKAQVGLFMRARRQGIAGLPLTNLELNSNFRSAPELVDWVNRSFSAIFPDFEDIARGQVSFRCANAMREEMEGCVDLSGHSESAEEAEVIAERIHQVLHQTGDDIAILVRNRRHLKAILPALRSRQIQWQALNIDPLLSRMAVMDVHNITRALCCPGDRIACLALLRAPWAALDMHDLLALMGAVNETSIPDTLWQALNNDEKMAALSKAGQTLMTGLKNELNRASVDLGKVSLRLIVERMWCALGGPYAVLEARDIDDVYDYLDCLEESERGGLIPDWDAFERSLAELYASPQALQTSGASDQQATARLQIMTIHKAKGLEFDQVFVPALEQRSRSSGKPLLLWWERESEQGGASYLLSAKPGSTQKDQASLYRYLHAEEKVRAHQETARLLYVACTRAKKNLYLSARVQVDDRGQMKKPASDSFLSLLWPEYESQFQCQPDKQQADLDIDAEQEVREMNSIRRLKPDWFNRQPQWPTWIAPQTGYPEKELTAGGDGKGVLDGIGFYPLLVRRAEGDLLHASLMRRVKAGDRRDLDGLNWDKAYWRAELRARGLRDADLETAVGRLTQMLHTTLNDPVGAWLLDSSHQDSQAELAIDWLDEHRQPRRARIDRTFLDQGVRWVVDYKSSEPQAGETVEQFLSGQLEQYRAQLSGYSRFFSEPRIKAMLYFPVIADAVVWTIKGEPE